MAQKSKRWIPLCPDHHRLGGYGVAYHAGRKGFAAAFGTEEDLWQKFTAE